MSNLICVLFGHKFGNWEYVSLNSCVQKRICIRDGYTEEIKTTPHHQFSVWEYIGDNSCEQMRICNRDGYSEKREMPHQWGEYDYVASDNCEQAKICKRCGTKLISYEKAHKWEHVTQEDESTRFANQDINLVEICRRCNTIRIERTEECTLCGGTGHEKEKTFIGYMSDPSFGEEGYLPCISCNGSGYLTTYYEIA